MSASFRSPNRAAVAIAAVVAAAVAAVGWAAFEPGANVYEEGRAALAAAGAAVVAVRWAVGARFRALADSTVIVWVAFVLGATVGVDLGRSVAGPLPSAWTTYHYRLNSKYFPELGYTDLYDQTLAAARGPQRARHRRAHRPQPRDVRARAGRAVARPPQRGVDRRAVAVVPVGPAVVLAAPALGAGPRGSGLQRHPHRQRRPPPARAPAADLDHPPRGGAPRHRPALGRLRLRRAHLRPPPRPRRGRLARAVAGQRAPPDRPPAAVRLPRRPALRGRRWRRDRPGLAGGLLAYAATVRVFPALLLAGPLAWGIVRRRRAGRWPAAPARFALAFAAACALFIAAGSLSGRGVGAWRDWTANIALHSTEHRLGDRRIGLQHVATFSLPEPGRWPSPNQRRKAVEGRSVALVLGALAALGLWIAAIVRIDDRRHDPIELLALSLWLVFAGVVLSRYYASAMVLLILACPEDRSPGRWAWIAGGLLGVVALFYAIENPIRHPYGLYVVANLLLCAWWLGTLAGLGVGRPEPVEAPAESS